MYKILLASTVVALLVASAPSRAQHATTKDQLIGTWKVETLKATTEDKVGYPLGERPTGYVTMTPERIWLLFVNSTRKAPAAATLTDAEAIAMIEIPGGLDGQILDGGADIGWHQGDRPCRYRIESGDHRQRPRVLHAGRWQ